MKNEEEIIEELICSLKISGNFYLAFLLDKYKDSHSDLLINLKKYNNNLFLEGLNDIKEDLSKISYINIQGILIDFRNIDRIEEIKEYNFKKQDFDYKLRIFKKFVTPLTEYFDIIYNTEEERKKSYDLLKAKLAYLDKKYF